MKKGFTLLEVLVGLTLMALILGVIQGVYSGVSRSSEDARLQTEGAHAGALLLQRLSDELNGAFPQSLTVRPKSESFSELSFTMPAGAAPQSAAAEGENPGGSVSVVYAVESSEEGGHTLTRSETFETETTSAGEPVELFPGITRFRIQCSTDAANWTDTASGGGDEGGPKVLSVEVGWKQGKGDAAAEHVIRTLIPLYRALG